ncbi:MAG: biopolymer transporter ExbD [Deltaproteobacteria bacterium]|nr:biopolymer transporter ExbD [Deltaproteobacteria bacterium]
MAGALQDDADEAISGINVTPLVDITLVLLIIFMVTASYIAREAIEVELPRAAHGGESVGAMLNIVLTKVSRMYIDGVESTEGELQRKVAAALLEDKNARAIISADQRALHGSVVHIIDLIKGQGIGKFAINIEKNELASSTTAVAPALSD